MFLTFVKCFSLILVSEDVQEFQKAIMKSGRKHHVIATNDDNDNDESNSEDEEDENPKNRRRKVSHSQVSADIIH